MSTKSDQHISQLMDGELEKDCSRFLLKRLQSDDELKQKWQNYHLLRNALQQNEAPLIVGLSAKVSKQLQAQQHTQIEPKSSNHSWSKALLGSAIAASVAFVAVFSLTGNQSVDTLSTSPNHAAYAKTSAQLIAPPTAYVARAEQPSNVTVRSQLMPEVQQYIMQLNGNRRIERVPYYYSAEYLSRLQKAAGQQLLKTPEQAQANNKKP